MAPGVHALGISPSREPLPGVRGSRAVRVSELRAILDAQPDDDGEIVVELPGTERGVQAISWASTSEGERLLVLVDL